jgi:hypothetical protein
MNISEQVHMVGREIAAATDEDLAATLNSALLTFLGDDFKSMPASVVDSRKVQSAVFFSVVYRTGTDIDAGDPPAVPADGTAAVVDGCTELTLDGLRDSYARIARVKALKKTPVGDGQTRTNVTLGIMMAARSAVPVESIMKELERLNARTPNKHWPDMIVIAATAVINYAVQFPGESVSGDFLPPAENAMANGTPAFYVVTVTRPTGTYAFNKMLVFLYAHLGIFMPGAKLPNWDAILEGVTKHAVTHTGYQYNLKGEIAPVPREFYNDRYLPPQPLLIEGPKGEILSAITYLPWQDGGAILLRGQLPLEGILVFLGRKGIEHGRVIQRPHVQISYVLPISEAEFRDMLLRFQRQSNMKVRRDAGHFIVQKIADEGTGTPFIARIMLGIMTLRDTVYTDESVRDDFDRLHESVTSSLFNARTSSQDIVRMWDGHARRVAAGEIAEVRGGNLQIAESIDRGLRREVESFLNAAVRTTKTGMQHLAKHLNMDIGFLFRQQGGFEEGIAAMEKTNPALAAYLRDVRAWTEPLLLLRNDLEHAIWSLPRVTYTRTDSGVRAEQPHIGSKPVTEFTADSFDRLCCFVEELTVHGLQRQMPPGITIAEVPRAERRAEAPERFRITLSAGGLPAWRIAYHANRFEET